MFIGLSLSEPVRNEDSKLYRQYLKLHGRRVLIHVPEFSATQDLSFLSMTKWHPYSSRWKKERRLRSALSRVLWRQTFRVRRLSRPAYTMSCTWTSLAGANTSKSIPMAHGQWSNREPPLARGITRWLSRRHMCTLVRTKMERLILCLSMLFN